MAIQEQILDLEALLSISDSVNVIVQPVGAAKAYRSTVGAIRTGLARTNSPTFTGTVLVPTVSASDVSDRAASTSLVDSKSRLVFNEIKQIKQVVHNITENQIIISSDTYVTTGISIPITPVKTSSELIIDINFNTVWNNNSAHWNTINLGWGGLPKKVVADYVGYANIESMAAKLILQPDHDGLVANASRTYEIFLKASASGSTSYINSDGSNAAGVSGMVITEIEV